MIKYKHFIITLLLVLFLCPAQVIAVEDNFDASVTWTGSNISVQYTGYEPGFSDMLTMTIMNTSSGETWTAKTRDKTFNKKVTDINIQTTGSIPQPQEGEVWTIIFDYGGQNPYTTSVDCWFPNQEIDDTGNPVPVENTAKDNMEGNWKSGAMPIFPGDSQKVVMFWYYSLATLSGAFMFLLFVKSGYQHIFSTTSNPGMRASVIMTVQRGIVGLIIIMLAPFIVNILISINDTFVDLCRQLLETAAQPVNLENVASLEKANAIENIISGAIDGINKIICHVLGLTPIGDLIFNQTPNCTIFNSLQGDFVNTNNVFADVILHFALLAYTLYFNIVYVVRRWVVTVVLAVTPIIIWSWIVSDNKQIIGLWVAELVQTIFMQTFHALTFGIVFSILAFSGGNLAADYINGVTISALLVGVGKYLAAFGGVACVAMLIIQAYRIILNSNEKERVDAIGKIKSALAGLVILSSSYMLVSAIFPHKIDIYHQGDIDVGNTVISIGAYTPEPTEITVFVLFFALVAIIPISKALSMIFMSIVARFGTVDEMGIAQGGMLALGHNVSNAFKKNKSSSGSIRSSRSNESSENGDSVGDSKHLTIGGNNQTNDASSGNNQISSLDNGGVERNNVVGMAADDNYSTRSIAGNPYFEDDNSSTGSIAGNPYFEDDNYGMYTADTNNQLPNNETSDEELGLRITNDVPATPHIDQLKAKIDTAKDAAKSSIDEAKPFLKKTHEVAKTGGRAGQAFGDAIAPGMGTITGMAGYTMAGASTMIGKAGIAGIRKGAKTLVNTEQGQALKTHATYGLENTLRAAHELTARRRTMDQ